MPMTIGKDKSTLKRGQKKGQVKRGMVGEWLCVSHKWRWDSDNFVRTYIHDDGEKLHMIFVFDWETEAVFAALGSTYSHSKHLGARLLVDAVFLSSKIRIWNHGLVRPNTFAGKITGVTEEHAERLPRVKAPWQHGVVGTQKSEPDFPAVQPETIRL